MGFTVATLADLRTNFVSKVYISNREKEMEKVTQK